MSDTAETTAPETPTSMSLQDAVSALARAKTAPAATPEPAATQEPAVTATAAGESDTPEVETTAEATPDAETDGEAQDEAPKAELPADTVAFILEDGTPVTVAEAKKGHLRQAQFTKLTQEHAEQKRVYTERESIIAQARNTYIERLQQVEAILVQRVPPEPDPQLKHTDPMAYVLARQERDDALVALATAHEERQREERTRTEQQTARLTETQKAERAALMEALPAWRDESTAAKEKASILAYAKALGFADDDVTKVFDGRADHRLALMLRDAAVGRKVREGGAKSGTTVNPAGVPQLSRAEARSAPALSPQQRELRVAREQLRAPSQRDRLAAAISILGTQERIAR